MRLLQLVFILFLSASTCTRLLASAPSPKPTASPTQTPTTTPKPSTPTQKPSSLLLSAKPSTASPTSTSKPSSRSPTTAPVAPTSVVHAISWQVTQVLSSTSATLFAQSASLTSFTSTTTKAAAAQSGQAQVTITYTQSSVAPLSSTSTQVIYSVVVVPLESSGYSTALSLQAAISTYTSNAAFVSALKATGAPAFVSISAAAISSKTTPVSTLISVPTLTPTVAVTQPFNGANSGSSTKSAVSINLVIIVTAVLCAICSLFTACGIIFYRRRQVGLALQEQEMQQQARGLDHSHVYKDSTFDNKGRLSVYSAGASPPPPPPPRRASSGIDGFDA